MSEISKKMMGFVAEKPAAPVAKWFQDQLTEGQLRSDFCQFLRDQPEALDPTLVVVDSVTESSVLGRIPRIVVDHESPKPLRVDVTFTFNPLTGQFSRTSV